ncbi:MAG: hypothetical protein ACYTG7_18465 [Planctomycetota bacterium]|jgi:hypothetical protein
MKKQTVFLSIVLLVVLSVPAIAENWVQSGEIIIDLDNTTPTPPHLTLQGAPSNGEVLENPGFETGSLDPWYSSQWFVTKEDPHSGSYCATDEGNYWIRQDFDDIKAEDVLSITLWSRQPEEAIQAVDLMYKDGTYFEDIIWPTSNWGFFDVTSWLTPGKTLVGIRIWGYSGGGGAPDISFIDDISIMTEGDKSLDVEPDEVSAYYGGKFIFTLKGGPDLAGRGYALFGGVSGTSPGTKLPSGEVLPLNWDWFTNMLLMMAMSGHHLVIDFIGTLDKEGNAEAALCFPGHCQLYEDITLYFAWFTTYPFDFVSNSVEALLLGVPQIPDEYFYDDGTTENLLTNFGGELCWANYFDVVPGFESLAEAGTLWGSTMWSGYGPGNGVKALLYIWEDTNGDKQLWDGDALVHTQTVITDEYDNDTHVYYAIDGGPLTITTAGFFVGFCLDHVSGQYVFPMDESQNPTNGNTWIVSMQLGAVDPINLSSNTNCQTMVSFGYDCYCPSRAR